MGLSFTKRESKLQNESFIYKTGVLDYKWDSRVAIHLFIIITRNIFNVKRIIFNAVH